MKLVRAIVKIGVLVCLAALFLPGLFTPWSEALYEMSGEENRRQLDSLAIMRKGGRPDAKCMIGDNFVINGLPRDFEKAADGNERVFFKAAVAIETPLGSTQTPKLENVRIRLCGDEEWTDLGACGEFETSTNDCWVTRYHELRLPERFEPQEGANAHVQVVVSASENADGDGAQRHFSKTFSYVFIPQIRSGRCKLLHWFTSL